MSSAGEVNDVEFVVMLGICVESCVSNAVDGSLKDSCIMVIDPLACGPYFISSCVE